MSDERIRELDRAADAGDRDAALEALVARRDAGLLGPDLSDLVAALEDASSGDTWDLKAWVKHLIDSVRRSAEAGDVPARSWRLASRAVFLGIARATTPLVLGSLFANSAQVRFVREAIAVGEAGLRTRFASTLSEAAYLENLASDEQWYQWRAFGVFHELLNDLRADASLLSVFDHVSQACSDAVLSGVRDVEIREAVQVEVANAALAVVRGLPRRRNQAGLVGLELAEMAADESLRWADEATDAATAATDVAVRRHRKLLRNEYATTTRYGRRLAKNGIDDDLRDLERRARTGDVDAAREARRLRVEIGSADAVDRTLEKLPQAARDAFDIGGSWREPDPEKEPPLWPHRPDPGLEQWWLEGYTATYQVTGTGQLYERGWIYVEAGAGSDDGWIRGQRARVTPVSHVRDDEAEERARVDAWVEYCEFVKSTGRDPLDVYARYGRPGEPPGPETLRRLAAKDARERTIPLVEDHGRPS